MCLIPLEEDEFISEGQVRHAYKVIWDDGENQYTGPFSHQKIKWNTWMKATSALDEEETAVEKVRVEQYDEWPYDEWRDEYSIVHRNPSSGFRISAHKITEYEPCFAVFFSQVLASKYYAAVVSEFYSNVHFIAGQMRVVEVQIRGRLRTGKLEPSVVFGNNPAATATEIYFDAS